MATTQSPDPNRVRIAELEEREIVRRGLELDERDVGQRVGAEHLRLERAPVVEADADVERALDHVVVGEDVAAGIDDEPAARALANLGPVPAAATEELLERIVAAALVALHPRGDVHVDHRGLHAVDQRGQRWQRGGLGRGLSRRGGLTGRRRGRVRPGGNAMEKWHGEETGGEKRRRREEATETVHVETQPKGRRTRRKPECMYWACP